MEAEDVLDSFLDEALTFTNDRNGGLETFITELTNAEPIIKREVELDRDEVRILTVHSSKGLEARVVFLIDHCGAAWSERHRPEILTIHDETHKKGYLWLTGKDQHVSATVESAALISEAAEAEYRRLLYVGMTRAADRLIVCGFKGVSEPNYPYWHRMVETALSAGYQKNKLRSSLKLLMVMMENRKMPRLFLIGCGHLQKLIRPCQGL